MFRFCWAWDHVVAGPWCSTEEVEVSDQWVRVRSLVALCVPFVLVAGCSSASSPAEVGSGDGAELDAARDAELLAVAEAGLADSDLSGPFYEFTLVEYSAAPEEEYDHASFLPDDAEVMYTAEVERQLQGETEWDWMEVVFYPDPATYLDTLASAGYAAAEVGRSENLADSHVALAEPVTPISGDPLVAGEEPDLGPLTASDDPDDAPFMLVAAVEIVDRDALDRHYEGASADGVGSSGAATAGVRPVRWMDVSTTLVGAEDRIDSVRFNHWPSHAAFEEVIGADPDTSNREQGLGATSTMMTLPVVNTFTLDIGDPAGIDLTEAEAAALYTPAAIDFLDATVGFSQCLSDAGEPWAGEPDADDPDVDPDYLAALAACASELDIEEALVHLFAEEPDAPVVTDVPPEYTSEAALGGLVAVDTFTSCLDEAGHAWMGQPGQNPDAVTEADSADYQAALAGCSGQSGIQAALDTLLGR
jgi:hypothetical protein